MPERPEDEGPTRRTRWRAFPQARAYVRSLGLIDQIEWHAYSRGELWRSAGTRPYDIPGNPHKVYADQGWAGMRDWLGPPPIEACEPGYLPFVRARRFARSLRIPSADAWRRWATGATGGRQPRPANIPERPDLLYPRAWRGWEDWLGRRRAEAVEGSRFRGFEAAREFARSLGLRDVKEWRAFCLGKRPDLGTRPADVPANPDSTYRCVGWNGYGDWLGSERVARREQLVLPFEQVRDLVRTLGLRSGEEYLDWIHGRRRDLPPCPRGVPTIPSRSYADQGWTTWGDFLGTGTVANYLKTYRTFESARELARDLGLRSHSEWAAFVRGERRDLTPPPKDVPACPDVHYRGCGWTNWGDFLGTGNRAPGSQTWRPFTEARAFARSLRLASVDEWRSWRGGELHGFPACPDDIPSNVERIYADQGWSGWPDFLGHRRCGRRWMPLEEASAIARRVGIRTPAEWHEWVHRLRDDLPDPPADVPVCPAATYAGRGWTTWSRFLGTPSLRPRGDAWRPFDEARAFARSLGLRSRAQWLAFRHDETRSRADRRLDDVPTTPHLVYEGRGWSGWPDFLGVEDGRAPRRRRAPPDAAPQDPPPPAQGAVAPTGPVAPEPPPP